MILNSTIRSSFATPLLCLPTAETGPTSRISTIRCRADRQGAVVGSLPEASPEFVAHQAAQTMAAAQYDAINATARMNQQVAAYAQAVKASAK